MCLELALIILLRKVTERLDESGRGFRMPIEKRLSDVGSFEDEADKRHSGGSCRTEFILFSTNLLAGRSRR
jgi:hypothetical protein